MRILYVEDQRVFAETVMTQFLSIHEVTIAETLASARMLYASSFEAILVDYDLPDGKGTEFVRHLRTVRFAGRIIAVSAKDDGNAELRAAGAHATCRKADLHQIATLLPTRPAP